MKSLLIIVCTLLLTGCTNAQPTINSTVLKITGNLLPSIQHITDMKMSGDTLLFVYENEEGYGQRCLRRAIVNPIDTTLTVSQDLGKRDDGYYISYMPYPFISSTGTIQVINQEDSEIYTIKNDTAFVKTTQYLMDHHFTLPFPLSQYVQDVFMMSPEKYTFIGREPNGGRQFAITSDLTSSTIDTIRQINVTPELQTWMPNTGEMTYTRKHNRFAFAYKFHPIVEIFDIEGHLINTVRIGDDTFDTKTLDEADFDEQNILHTVDVTSTMDYIYLLHWGYKYSEASIITPTIYKLDWNGKILAHYTAIPKPLYRIAVLDDTSLIGWNGKEFLIFIINDQ